MHHEGAFVGRALCPNCVDAPSVTQIRGETRCGEDESKHSVATAEFTRASTTRPRATAPGPSAASEGSSSAPPTVRFRRELPFRETRAHERFREFGAACTAERYVGSCFGRSGVGRNRSAREVAASPTLITHTLGKPVAAEIARAVEGCQGPFSAAPVHTTRKIINDRPRFSLCRLEHARLALAGLGEGADHFARTESACPLAIMDEADRLTVGPLEHLRDLYGRHGFGPILTGMPGLEGKLARSPQLHWRIGFVHRFRPLREAEMRSVAGRRAGTFGNAFDPGNLAAVLRITRGTPGFVGRLLAGKRRSGGLDGTQIPSADDAARDRLGIGPGG